ncbi:hypothetical protein ABG79_01257 [Caloramator mitchellensis]|uniref:FlgN protein n=1 Tax=Caloramator mitchellensis TaxID=908809 RepID=A0A0R3JU95_CALMK|nr:hypothetical protein [Caloramator mitchellensis]KRQ87064.1 hypothetical protein ABG79_01257 [Caloramator mitchellensis]
MFDEIIELYNKQLEKYKEIYTLLSIFEGEEEIDIDKYNEQLQNISFDLEVIDKANQRVEQLKEIYILKKNITDFTKNEIERIEDAEKFKLFNDIIKEIAEVIKNTKKLQDKIITKLNKQLSSFSNLLKENEYAKKMAEGYVNISKSNNIIDVKK